MAEFRAMGNTCRIVAPDAALAAAGESMVHALDERWSRFRSTSEVTALNRCAGDLTIVSAETFALVQHAEAARIATGGWFHPLQLTRLEQLGYRESWTEAPDDDAEVASPAPACPEPIELMPELSAVRLPVGTRFDPGGIGKGLAGDLVAAHLLELGARSVQVELGGDVRVAGTPWVGDQWRVAVQHLDGSAECAQLVLAGGGVATSGIHRRTWRRGERQIHHLIDPHTGWPAETDLAAATVSASSLWFAEVVAKSVVMMGGVAGRCFLRERHLAGVLHRSNETSTAVEVVTNMEDAA